MDEKELIIFLRNNLTIKAKVKSNYTGGLDGNGSLYKDDICIQLCLDTEIISEINI